MAQAVLKAGVPAVELRSPRLCPDLPWVGVDNHAMGEMVAAHLLERGFRNFAVLEMGTESYFKERRVNFMQVVKQAGFTCHEFNPGGQPERPSQWESNQESLSAWVHSLPKPCGVMACTDQLGFFLLDACARAGVSVPEQVAVVGVENDETLCTMGTPTLSSVRLNAEQIGYQAASLLARMMRGHKPPRRPILVEPMAIEVRASSDVLAIDDQQVAVAMQFIRENAADGISVNDILRNVPMSRSSLERRMKAAIGRTPNEEITRVRIEHVKLLLQTTDLDLAAIARRSGYSTSQYLVQIFRKSTGLTPGQFRGETRV
jgi:LacI family transcriptional regulator